MKKLGFWTIFSLTGTIAESLQKASSDGKISVNEAIEIIKSVCKSLNIDFDEAGVDLSPGSE